MLDTQLDPLRLAFSISCRVDEIVGRLEQQFPIPLPKYVCKTFSKIISNYSGWCRSREIEDLKELFLKVELLSCTIIGREVLDMIRECRYERQEVEVLLLCRQGLELGNIELGVRRRLLWWSCVRAIDGGWGTCRRHLQVKKRRLICLELEIRAVPLFVFVERDLKVSIMRYLPFGLVRRRQIRSELQLSHEISQGCSESAFHRSET
jgi:hypothetical protein